MLAVAAFALLTLAGAVLWRRTRTLATALIAIGFALVLAEQVSTLVGYLEFGAILNGHSGDTLFVIQHHGLLRYVSILGLCAAALGLMWHAARKSSAAGDF